MLTAIAFNSVVNAVTLLLFGWCTVNLGQVVWSRVFFGAALGHGIGAALIFASVLAGAGAP